MAGFRDPETIRRQQQGYQVKAAQSELPPGYIAGGEVSIQSGVGYVGPIMMSVLGRQVSTNRITSTSDMRWLPEIVLPDTTYYVYVSTHGDWFVDTQTPTILDDQYGMYHPTSGMRFVATFATNADRELSRAGTHHFLGATNIQAGAIQTENLASGAVETDNLAAGAVETDKLAAGAVETDKLAAEAVEAGNLATDAIQSRNWSTTDGSYLDLTNGLLELRDSSTGITRYVKIGPSEGLRAYDALGTVTHDIPSGNIDANHQYMGHVVWFATDSDTSSYELYHGDWPDSTWQVVTAVSGGFSNVNGAILEVRMYFYVSGILPPASLQTHLDIAVRPYTGGTIFHDFMEINAVTDHLSYGERRTQISVAVDESNRFRLYARGRPTASNVTLRMRVLQLGVLV
jgi:hypothetical protein